MAVFEIYTKSDEQGLKTEQDRQVHLVKTSASLVALILPLIWLLWHRLWFYFAIFVLFNILIFGLGTTKYSIFLWPVYLLPNLYLYFEGPNLLAGKHIENGYQLIDVIIADNREEAELKWHSKVQSTCQNNVTSITPMPTKLTTSNSAQDRVEFGLFAEE